MQKRVFVEDKEGRRYAIEPGDLDTIKDAEGKTYADRGFKIVSWETGEAYEAPKAGKATPAPAEAPSGDS